MLIYNHNGKKNCPRGFEYGYGGVDFIGTLTEKQAVKSYFVKWPV